MPPNHYTHKVAFRKVFKGRRNAHYLRRLEWLLAAHNRLCIQVTHFTKWYLLNTDEATYHVYPLKKLENLILITKSMNARRSAEAVPQPVPRTNRSGRVFNVSPEDYFEWRVDQYKRLVGYFSEEIPAFGNMSSYMADTFHTNILSKCLVDCND